MSKQMKTIKLQGKDYAPVNERIKAFHEAFKNGSIQTEPKSTERFVSVKATVIPDIHKPERIFTAHSYGTIKGIKAFEKLETVAVGRALAYLGFGIDGSIASFEEMETFYEKESDTEVKKDEKNQNITWLDEKTFNTLKALAETGTKENLDKVHKYIKGYSTDTMKMKKEYKTQLENIINSKLK